MYKNTAIKKEYDFSNKDPCAALTEDELENFDEGMKLKNSSVYAGSVSLKRAVEAVTVELDELFA
jgi:hypothetical protein